MKKLLFAIFLAILVLGTGTASVPDVMARGRAGLVFTVYEQDLGGADEWEAITPWRGLNVNGLNRSACLNEFKDSIDNDWEDGSPGGSCGDDDWLAHYSGYITPTRSGAYTFYARVDDGVWLKIGRSVVLHDWEDQGPSEYNTEGKVRLQRGLAYPLEGWMYENGGGAVFELYYSIRGSEPALVPSSWFTH
jgi:predicted alpha-1,6-mannanase (GH76 family)